ncbi:hypothetical protein GU926_14180 [Nibribacter ruber]|uniref:DUF4430 domain-containing protein n=1 Tax=Nibribacter ruber TaxID=2698458 RepID=A0A6P1P295_9BACT|nr:hypothetical protein [Nibribacter ruber]QHL88518.1 hypothetical protein GU926_14180 [Nibribacter ruber]
MAQASQPEKELTVTLNGKPINFEEKYSIDQLRGKLDFTIKDANLVKVTIYLIRGALPFNIYTINGPDDYKDFQFAEWLKGNKGKAKEGKGFQHAKRGDRVLFEYVWDGGASAVNLHLK